MQWYPTRAALVSTNSIAQGEQPGNLWPFFFEDGIQIDFAYRTFRWDSEASQKAHVHCVIIGFSNHKHKENNADKFIYDGADKIKVSNINGYLIEAEDVYIGSRSKPLCDVPEMFIGNKPIDGGFYLFSESEKDEFVSKEPASASLFKPWFGSEEFINNKKRYCLWLGDCTPQQLRSMPLCMKRIEAVRNFRLNSKSEGTVKLADTPTRFHVECMPKEEFILFPQTSSEKRSYIPIGFMNPNVFCSNAVRVIPGASLFHFGVLTSVVHMAWVRVVSGRLETRYQYSANNVYNNFPWPKVDEKAKKMITHTAQGIVDARRLYPDSSMSDLYDNLVMPIELRRAHRANDAAVMEAYGFPKNASESEIVAQLFKMYRELTEDK